jgi:hypothetical protein
MNVACAGLGCCYLGFGRLRVAAALTSACVARLDQVRTQNMLQ